MSEPVILFLIAQTVAILGAIVAFGMGASRSLAEIKTKVEHLEGRRSEALVAHDSLNEKVQGISRIVERHETLLQVTALHDRRGGRDDES